MVTGLAESQAPRYYVEVGNSDGEMPDSRDGEAEPMSRDRSLLHVKHLAAFIGFCEGRGWMRLASCGEFEALRMHNPAMQDPLIVHRKAHTLAGGEPVHLTVWGNSEILAREFIAQSRRLRRVE